MSQTLHHLALKRKVLLVRVDGHAVRKLCQRHGGLAEAFVLRSHVAKCLASDRQDFRRVDRVPCELVEREIVGFWLPL